MTHRFASVMLVISCAALSVAQVGCTVGYEPGPFHACAANLWEDWETRGGTSYCSCDLDHPPPEPAERVRLLRREWAVELLAPPGSFSGHVAPITGSVMGHPITGATRADGSAFATAAWEAEEPLDEPVTHQPTGATLDVLGARFTVALPAWVGATVEATNDDPRFPEGAWAIEDPLETIELRMRFRGARPETVGISAAELAYAGPLVYREVDEDGVLATTIPGSAGTSLALWALLPGHTALCGAMTRTFCHCSARTLEVHACPYVLPTPIDGGTRDAGPPDAELDWDAGETGPPF
jgi:hypothetical protein